jgi:hypothetical protein
VNESPEELQAPQNRTTNPLARSRTPVMKQGEHPWSEMPVLIEKNRSTGYAFTIEQDDYDAQFERF